MLFFENFDNVINYVHNFLAHPANATIILLDFIFAIVERSEVTVVLLYIPRRRERGEPIGSRRSAAP